MDLIANWIEEKIQAAVAKGEFKNLPGEGKPLDLEDDSFIPAEMRMSYRVLKNANMVPPEILVLKEINELQKQLSDKNLTYDQYQTIKRKITFKQSELNMSLERLQRMQK